MMINMSIIPYFRLVFNRFFFIFQLSTSRIKRYNGTRTQRLTTNDGDLYQTYWLASVRLGGETTVVFFLVDLAIYINIYT